MQPGIHEQLVFLLLLLVVAIFAAVAQRIRVPYPIVLVVAGLVLSFIPRVPTVELEPDVIFYVILPLLLYWAAWHTSWREFTRNIASIAVLAIGLVAFTVFGVAAAAPLLLPGFDWRSGFLLGAVIAPTDAIAATSIARRLGLQKRIVDIIEGESLVNDATGLLALEIGTAMLLVGRLPSVAGGTLRFVYVCVAGVVAGVVVGFLVHRLERLVDEAPIVITISVLVPYAAYFAADVLHASGVLAVVACGLYVSRQSDEFRSARVRLEAAAVWNALAFILNGLVFVLIGLQLRPILAALGKQSFGALLLYVAIFSALVIALRLVWVYPAISLGALVANRLLHRAEPPLSNRGKFIIGWASMRGVIALAAAMSLPRVLPDGRPFTPRAMIIFLTFGAIFLSLVVKGVTFPIVIRRLGLAGTAEPEFEELEARRILLDSAVRFLDSRREAGEVFDEHDDDLRYHYAARLAAVDGAAGDEHGTAIEHATRYNQLSREMLNVQRRTAIRIRNEGRINDEVLRALLAELDLGETRLNLDLDRLNATARMS